MCWDTNVAAWLIIACPALVMLVCINSQDQWRYVCKVCHFSGLGPAIGEVGLGDLSLQFSFYCISSLCAGNMNKYFAFCFILPLWNGQESWNPFPWKTRPDLSYSFNTIAADCRYVLAELLECCRGYRFVLDHLMALDCITVAGFVIEYNIFLKFNKTQPKLL